MADIVQMRLEQMLPEIEDLEKKKIFNKAELTSITNKRKRFEYFLARRIPKKIDFLRYIEFELNLDALRKKRKARIIAAAKANKQDKEKSEYFVDLMRVTLSDYSITRRVHSLYDKALRRFPGDVDLWIQYLEWAQKTSNSKLLGKIFPRVISLHPTKDVFWILAASWEFEKNGNALSGRTLLQRGLRLNGESKRLWLEYFRLELLYLEKLRERRKILFGKKNQEEKEKAEDGTDNMEVEKPEIDLPVLEQENTSSEDSITSKIAEMIKATNTTTSGSDQTLDPAFQAETPAQIAFFTGAIPKLIYKNAIKVIPNDLKFRLEFIRIYNKFGNWTSSGVDEVYQSIEEDFKGNEEAQGILSERYVINITVNDVEFPLKLKMCIDSYEKCVSEINNEKIWECYKQFLEKYLEECEEENLKLYLSKSLKKLYHRANELGLLSENMFISWSKFDEENKKDIITQGLKKYPTSSKILYENLKNEFEDYKQQNEKTKKDLIPIFEKAIKVIDANDSFDIWNLYLEYLKNEVSLGRIENEFIENTFKRIISSIGLEYTKYENYMINNYLDWANETYDITKIRTIYKDLIASKQRSSEFFQKCIELEILYAEKPNDSVDIMIEDIDEDDSSLNRLIQKLIKKEVIIDTEKLNMKSIRYLFEQIVNCDVKNIDMWLAYITIELKYGNDVEISSGLYLRAIKELKFYSSETTSEEFERRYQELKKQLY